MPQFAGQFVQGQAGFFLAAAQSILAHGFPPGGVKLLDEVYFLPVSGPNQTRNFVANG
jgi:hypothetical protein